MSALPSEQVQKEISLGLLELIGQYDNDRTKVIAQVEDDKLVSQPDEIPNFHPKEPATVEEAKNNVIRDIRMLRRGIQSKPLDNRSIQEALGTSSGTGRTVYTESFKQELRREATNKALDWVEQQPVSTPGVLQINDNRIEYKLVRKNVDWHVELSDNPEAKLANLEVLRRFITEDMRKHFGSWERITSVTISGGQLILNGIMYVPLIPPGYIKYLPLDVADYVSNGCIAALFNYYSLRSMKRLHTFYCDDVDFYTINIADDLGLGRRIGVSSLFNICGGLDRLIIGNEEINRKDLYSEKSRAMKLKIRMKNLFVSITDGYKFNVYAGTDGLQNFAFSNLKNYATNRGNKGIFRFCLGTATRTALAVGATGVNLALHIFGGIGKAVFGVDSDTESGIKT